MGNSRQSFGVGLLVYVALVAVVISGSIACGPRRESETGTSGEKKTEAPSKSPEVPVMQVFGAADLKSLAEDQWWDVETPEGLDPFVWSRSEAALIKVDLNPELPLQISVKCWPFSWGEAPPQKLSIFLNDGEIETFELKPEVETYTSLLPRALIREGKNELEFRFDHVGRPVDHVSGSEDDRRLAVAFISVTVEPGPELKTEPVSTQSP